MLSNYESISSGKWTSQEVVFSMQIARPRSMDLEQHFVVTTIVLCSVTNLGMHFGTRATPTLQNTPTGIFKREITS